MHTLLAQPLTLLKQARSPEMGLPERLRALATMAQTIDHLFAQHRWSLEAKPAGLLLGKRRSSLSSRLSCLWQGAARLLRNQLLPLLNQYQVRLLSVDQLGEQQQAWLAGYFRGHIYPLLTPLAVDSGHPFPHISSNSVNLLILFQPPTYSMAAKKPLYACLKIPCPLIPHLIRVPTLAQVDSPVLHQDGDLHYLVWSEEVIRYFVHELFAGMSVTGIHPFRALRACEHTGASDSRHEVGLDKIYPVVLLDVHHNMPDSAVNWLATHLDVPGQAVFRCGEFVNMNSLVALADQLEALAPAQTDNRSPIISQPASLTPGVNR
jgi:polyphosphate kinase